MLAYFRAGDNFNLRFRAGAGLGPAQHQRALQMACCVQPVGNAGVFAGNNRTKLAVAVDYRLATIEAALVVEPVDGIPE